MRQIWRLDCVCFPCFLLFQETHLEKQRFLWIACLGGFFVLATLVVVPSEPDEPRLGMPTQSAWKFCSFFVLHVICFLQISQSVKRALFSSRGAEGNQSTATKEFGVRRLASIDPTTSPALFAAGYRGVAPCAGVFANQMLPAGCCQSPLVKHVKHRNCLKRLAAPQGFEPRYADPELMGHMGEISCFHADDSITYH